MKTKDKVSCGEVKKNKLKAEIKRLKSENMNLLSELEKSKLNPNPDPLSIITQYGSESSLRMLSVIVNSFDYHRVMDLLNCCVDDLQELHSKEIDNDEKDNCLTKILALTRSAVFIGEVFKIHADLNSH